MSEHRQSIITCDHVHVAYGRQDVIHDVSINITSGVLLPFVGPNGAGKTTLLRAIIGLLPVRSGHISTPFAEKPAGYVPQQKSIDPLYPVTTRQIIEMGLYPELGWWRRPSPEQRARIHAIMERFGLSAHQSKTFSELSGGMKQKAILARALVSGAEVFVLDEPTSEFDEETERDVLSHLVSMVHDEGKTVLMAYHGLEQAAAMTDTVCVVNHGKAHITSVRGAQGLLVGTSSAGRHANA